MQPGSVRLAPALAAEIFAAVGTALAGIGARYRVTALQCRCHVVCFSRSEHAHRQSLAAAQFPINGDGSFCRYSIYEKRTVAFCSARLAGTVLLERKIDSVDAWSVLADVIPPSHCAMTSDLPFKKSATPASWSQAWRRMVLLTSF